MYHKNFWFGVNGLIFLLVIFSYVTKIQGNGEDDTDNNDDNTDDNNAYYSTSTVTGTTKKYVKKYSGKKSYDTYGQDYAGYDDNYGGYGSSVNKGIDPDTYGQDIADDGEIYEDKDSMAGSLNLWIRSAHRWDEPDKKRYRGGKYDKKRYGKDSKKKYSKTGSYKGQDYKEDDDYDKNERYDGDSKYEKVTFPVRYYKDYKKFPIRRFPPLFSTFPWLPVFYDKITYQTFVVSPAGGIIVMPPLINFFGQRFAVAQLIKWGYASLVSGVLPPPAGFDVAPLVQPAGAPGAPAAPSLPYNPQNGQFNGGVTTGYGSFKPRGY